MQSENDARKYKIVQGWGGPSQRGDVSRKAECIHVATNEWSESRRLAASVLLGLSTVVGAGLHCDCLSARGLDDIVRRLECLVGYDAVDFCWLEDERFMRRSREGEPQWIRVSGKDIKCMFSPAASGAMLGALHLPVRMFWNACSTLEASSAEVSMNERLFSAVMRRSEFALRVGQSSGQRETISDLDCLKWAAADALDR